MHANWPLGKAKKDQSMKDVESIINVISELRSFKNELNVSPGSFIDISINKIAKKNKTLMTLPTITKIKKNKTAPKPVPRMQSYITVFQFSPDKT
jgi:valyl-tRNA synthetase